MSTRMSDVIQEIKDRATVPWYRRLAKTIKRKAAGIVWILWGRRRVMAQMKKLALIPSTVSPPRKTPAEIDSDLDAHRRHLDSLHADVVGELLPRPDSEDVN